MLRTVFMVLYLKLFIICPFSVFASVIGYERRKRSALSLERQSADEKPLSFSVVLDRSLDHEGKPFTQGLEWSPDNQFLIETSGAWPVGTPSFIRVVDPVSGRTVKKVTTGIGNGVFVEGITLVSGNWHMLTYQDRKIVTYNQNFQVVGNGQFPLDGWGVAPSPGGQDLLVTNGTEWLMTVGLSDMKIKQTKPITCYGKHVSGLNELELVDNFQGHGPMLFGNLIDSRLVLMVDPSTARCKGVLSLTRLEPVDQQELMGYHVANGIAYNKHSQKFMVTGKNWGKMYEISVKPTAPTEPDAAECLRKLLVDSSSSSGLTC